MKRSAYRSPRRTAYCRSRDQRNTKRSTTVCFSVAISSIRLVKAVRTLYVNFTSSLKLEVKKQQTSSSCCILIIQDVVFPSFCCYRNLLTCSVNPSGGHWFSTDIVIYMCMSGICPGFCTIIVNQYIIFDCSIRVMIPERKAVRCITATPQFYISIFSSNTLKG